MGCCLAIDADAQIGQCAVDPSVKRCTCGEAAKPTPHTSLPAWQARFTPPAYKWRCGDGWPRKERVMVAIAEFLVVQLGVLAALYLVYVVLERRAARTGGEAPAGGLRVVAPASSRQGLSRY